MSKISKVIIAILALVIVAGIIVIATSGFNLGYEYDASKKLYIEFKENFEMADVDNMMKEVLGVGRIQN